MEIVFISSIFPQTNYSGYLSEAIIQITDKEGINFSVYHEKDRGLTQHENFYATWRPGFFSFFQIIYKISKDKPQIVHIHHELNMYGGIVSVLIFPLFVVFLKVKKVKSIVTIHAVSSLKAIDDRFVSVFRGDATHIKPWMLKIIFIYVYSIICRYASLIIVHTSLLKSILVNDYKAIGEKVEVIPHGVPMIEVRIQKKKDDKFYLFFGYIVRRKGLENVIHGFSRFMERNRMADVKLVLAGGVIQGQEFALDEIKKMIRRLGIEQHVYITGFIDKKEIKEFFNNAYAVILPASLSVAASGPLAQAFAYGKCVIASKIGNLCEEIQDGYNGILIENSKWEDAFEFTWKNEQIVRDIEQHVVGTAIERNWNRIASLHVQLYKRIYG